MALIRELVICSPLLVIGFGLLYYFGREQPRQQREPAVAEQVEALLEGEEDVVFDEEDFDEGEEEDVDDEEEVHAGMNGHQQQPEAAAGPSRRRQKVVGAKKSKSLARRDQIRAYNEFVRQRAQEEKEAQRLFEEQHKEQIESEKRERERRHAEATAKIQSRKGKERQQYQQEKQLHDSTRKKLVDEIEKTGKTRLESDLDLEIAQTLDKGYVVQQGSWLVKPSNDDLVQLAGHIGSKGRLSFEELSDYLKDM
ncbi:hypothetical protein TRICI_002048 [Trichomonascus ciferrii]|uniref:Uncharacterized protein n=1 Tax=Trichomonascus ciferrii TaxID=44093 RepID=A0A642V933_9ASCO|nr:hypothetical protein TRICI_002048 [Trichomonascus ciferrii]